MAPISPGARNSLKQTVRTATRIEWTEVPGTKALAPHAALAGAPAARLRGGHVAGEIVESLS
jgi:hypothetical protein